MRRDVETGLLPGQRTRPERSVLRRAEEERARSSVRRMGRERRNAMRMFLSFFLALGLVSAAHAAPGDLDTSFSGDGKVITGLPGGARFNAVAIQADGRIVAAGGCSRRWRVTSPSRDTSPTAPSTRRSAAASESSRPTSVPRATARRASPFRPTAGSSSPASAGSSVADRPLQRRRDAGPHVRCGDGRLTMSFGPTRQRSHRARHPGRRQDRRGRELAG